MVDQLTETGEIYSPEVEALGGEQETKSVQRQAASAILNLPVQTGEPPSVQIDALEEQERNLSDKRPLVEWNQAIYDYFVHPEYAQVEETRDKVFEGLFGEFLDKKYDVDSVEDLMEKGTKLTRKQIAESFKRDAQELKDLKEAYGNEIERRKKQASGKLTLPEPESKKKITVGYGITEEQPGNVETLIPRIKKEFLYWMLNDKPESVSDRQKILEMSFPEEEGDQPEELKSFKEFPNLRVRDMDIDPSKVDFDVPEFKNLWGGENTKVTYVFDKDEGGNPKNYLLFEGSDERGGKKSVKIGTSTFSDPEKLGSDFEEYKLPELEDNNEQNFWEEFTRITLDSKPMKTTKFEARHLEREDVVDDDRGSGIEIGEVSPQKIESDLTEDRSAERGATKEESRELWASEDTVIEYVVSEGGENEDSLRFIGKSASGEKISSQVRMPDLIRMMPALNVRPLHSRYRMEFWDKLKLLTLGRGDNALKIGSKEFRVRYPIKLQPNEEKLEKFTDDEIKKDVLKFISLWTSAKPEDKITNFGMIYENSEIKDVKIKTKSGEYVKLPYIVFRSVFDGISTRSLDRDSVLGERVVYGAKNMELLPNQSSKNEDILRSFVINDHRLPYDVKIYFGPPVKNKTTSQN